MRCAKLLRALAVAAWLPAGAAGLAAGAPGAAAEPADAPPHASENAPLALRVMSFNILSGKGDRHVGRWDDRRALVAARVKAFDPDLLGLQEALDFQAEYLRGELPGHGYVGVGRSDGAEKGPQTAIFYRLARFEKLQEGHFWLSKTPDRAGSKDWMSWVPRMVSWVKLRPRGSGETIYFYNTHFDSLSAWARTKSAELLRERIAQTAGSAPAIVTGDFNARAGKDTYRALLGGDGGDGLRLIDSYRAVHPVPARNEGTYRLVGGIRVNRRLDWILHTPRLRAVEAGIDLETKDGRPASDHYPVTAVLHLTDGARE